MASISGAFVRPATSTCSRDRRGGSLLMKLLASLIFSLVTSASMIHAFSISTDSSKVLVEKVGDLDSLTIPQLKDLISENGLQEKGLKSRLKRKSDFVDFIRESFDKLQMENQSHPSQEVTDDLSEEEFFCSDEIRSMLSSSLAKKLVSRGITSLLPIQVETFKRIYDGKDCMIHAPTGSGKTLSYILPLLSAPKKRSWSRTKAAAPRILTICPSRELAQQVTREWNRYWGSQGAVCVFGGVPLERHISKLRQKPQIVVGTPGRIRELNREGYLNYTQIASIVFDEADILVDKGDSPDVFAILNKIESDMYEADENAEYQLTMVSATVNAEVINFATELGISSKALIQVSGIGAKSPTENAGKLAPPVVNHFYSPCQESARAGVISSFVKKFSPRLCIIFCSTKTETEALGAVLTENLKASVRVLHGDMTQSARGRCINLIRESLDGDIDQVLIATDIASRGLDLPKVDLVIQCGVPRQAGKEGTFSADLYVHRTGRAGRAQASQDVRGGLADAILLYDPTEGEGKLVEQLMDQIRLSLAVDIKPISVPGAEAIVDSSYENAMTDLLKMESKAEILGYIKQKLADDANVNTESPEQLLDLLARALASVSSLDTSVALDVPGNSLMTGDPSLVTMRATHQDSIEISPTDVTKLCKSLGSGKLGRVTICQDGSAVFDLRRSKSRAVITAFQSSADPSVKGWRLEIPNELPTLKSLR